MKSHYGLLGLIAPNHCSARAVLIAFNGICRRGRPSLLLPANLGSYLVLRSPDCFILGDIQLSKSNLRTGLVVDHHMWLLPMVANHRSNDAMFAMYPSSLYLDIFQGFISVHSESVSISFSKFNYSYSFQKEENLFQISWRFSKYHCKYQCISIGNEFIVIHFVRKWILFN